MQNTSIPPSGISQSIEPADSSEASTNSSAGEATVLQLSPAQYKAIEQLTAGQTVVASAAAAGVTRLTLYRWLKNDPAFQAAYNAWQHDAIATARGRLLAMTESAVTTVSQAVSAGDAKTALTILKSLGLLGVPTPGSTDPSEVERKQRLENRKAEGKRFLEEELAILG